MTLRDRLFTAYANLAMAHAAVTDGAQRYGPKHFMIRARLLKGLQNGTMKIGTLLADERIKLVQDKSCAYCGADGKLSLDHLLPKNSGGPESADNVVWACRTCNSSKKDTDVLRWLSAQGRFPFLLLLRRYLKLAIQHSESAGIMDSDSAVAGDLPFDVEAIPTSFPAPAGLALWVAPRAP
ncbi:MAG: HNH endonuclease [Planctomycetes bacterium]|nr:HNH endonuclease [Planctomycetota bacterium]